MPELHFARSAKWSGGTYKQVSKKYERTYKHTEVYKDTPPHIEFEFECAPNIIELVASFSRHDLEQIAIDWAIISELYHPLIRYEFDQDTVCHSMFKILRKANELLPRLNMNYFAHDPD